GGIALARVAAEQMPNGQMIWSDRGNVRVVGHGAISSRGRVFGAGFRRMIRGSAAAGQEFLMGEGAGAGQPLADGQDLAGPQGTQQQAVIAAAVQLPVAHRAAVEMDEMRVRIPADAAPLHRPRRMLDAGKPAVEGDVDRAAIEMLAALGDAEG